MHGWIRGGRADGFSSMYVCESQLKLALLDKEFGQGRVVGGLSDLVACCLTERECAFTGRGGDSQIACAGTERRGHRLSNPEIGKFRRTHLRLLLVLLGRGNSP